MAVDTYIKISAASTNAALVVAGAAELTAFIIANLSQGAMQYVKLYDKASPPTVGTDVPVITFGIPPLSAPHEGLDDPIEFAVGIAIAMTAGPADADAVAIAADSLVANLVFEQV